jgi:two-component system, chemotaxis family, protein-glutamate methylesterase/glutaminase
MTPSRTFVVASSAGGLNALLALLPTLSADFPAPVICVQHMHPHQPSLLVDILARRCAIRIAFASEGAMPEPGQVLVAPPARHTVMREDGRLSLWDGPLVNHVRPSADLLFSSTAVAAGPRTVAVVLSGTGHDGAAGAAAVHEAGGIVLVQSPGNCDFPGMVEATMRLVEPDGALASRDMGAAFERLAAEAAV